MLRRQPGRPRPAPGSPSRGTSPRSSGTSRGRPGIPPWRSGRGRTRQEARTSGPCQGQAGCCAARRAAVPGQVSARAVPVAARPAGPAPGGSPAPGGRQPGSRLQHGAVPGEAGEQGTGPPGQYHHPPVLVELQRPAQAEFSLADRPGQPLRARNNRTAGEDTRASGSDPSGGTASGGSGKTASPERPAAPGWSPVPAAPGRRPAGSPSARRRRPVGARSYPAPAASSAVRSRYRSAWITGVWPVCRTPSAAITCAETSPGSVMLASPASHTRRRNGLLRRRRTLPPAGSSRPRPPRSR